jgi:hypothetical protein
VIRPGTCRGATGDASPTDQAEHTIPARYLTLYRETGAAYGVPWPVLAGIGAKETDHGRSSAPGVRAGVNSYGCCAGPMQFNLTDGPPSTWERYGVDGDHDGDKEVYDPEDAIPSAARSAPRRPRASSRPGGNDLDVRVTRSVQTVCSGTEPSAPSETPAHPGQCRSASTTHSRSRSSSIPSVSRASTGTPPFARQQECPKSTNSALESAPTNGAGLDSGLWAICRLGRRSRAGRGGEWARMMAACLHPHW